MNTPHSQARRDGIRTSITDPIALTIIDDSRPGRCGL